MAEREEQAALVEWFRLQYPQYNKAIRLSLNGVAFRNGKEAARRKAEAKKQGLTIGESDLMFTVARGGYHGLCIEMKSENGRLSEDQSEYLGFMREMGYAAFCCKGAAEAIGVVREYMG